MICYLFYTLLVSDTNFIGHQVGLVLPDKLKNENEAIRNKTSQAYKVYTLANSSDYEAIAFKQQYCCSVQINFLGVWWVLKSCC
jgi:hypothetical protein